MKVYVLMLMKETYVYDIDIKKYITEYEYIVFGVFDSVEKACEVEKQYSDEHDEYFFYIEECELNYITDKAMEEIE